MKKVSSQLVLLLLLICPCLIGHLHAHPAEGKQKIESVPILEAPEYSHRVHPALKRLVRQRGTESRNHFFVSDLAEDLAVLVYWREKNRIILFAPHTGSDFQDLVASNRNWDLEIDVGPIEVAQTSTYLLTQEMADEMKQRCLQGTPFVIQR